MSSGLDPQALALALDAIEAQIAAIRRAIGVEKGPTPERAAPDLIDADLIDLATVAKAMRRSKETTRAWLRRRGLSERIGGRVFVRESSLRACLSRPV